MTVRPLSTVETLRDEFSVKADSVYFHGASSEEPRGDLGVRWKDRQARRGVRFVTVTGDGADIVLDGGSSQLRFNAPADDQVISWIEDTYAGIEGQIVLDITSMSHDVWAPLMKSATLAGLDLLVVYTEPSTYRRASVPTPGQMFDLSERIQGIAPLPGFARLPAASREAPVFVPMLGFEGARYSYVRESVQIEQDRTFPIVGVPGFQPEFPGYTYESNRREIEEGFHGNVRLAKANCPFDVFHVLGDVAEAFPGARIRVAPIGTKPHAVGAVLFALSGLADVEIVYDHPLRSAGRSEGSGRVCVFPIGDFAAEYFPEAAFVDVRA